jgi:nitrate reductase NapD
MSGQSHIAGLVVFGVPRRLADVAAALTALAGVEIHAVDPCGKLVVTLETDGGLLNERIREIHDIEGVLTVNLVYHQVEDARMLEEDVTDEDHPS